MQKEIPIKMLSIWLYKHIILSGRTEKKILGNISKQKTVH